MGSTFKSSLTLNGSAMTFTFSREGFRTSIVDDLFLSVAFCCTVSISWMMSPHLERFRSEDVKRRLGFGLGFFYF